MVDRGLRIALELDRCQLWLLMDKQLAVEVGDLLAVYRMSFSSRRSSMRFTSSRLFLQSVEPEPMGVHHAPPADIAVARADVLVA